MKLLTSQFSIVEMSVSLKYLFCYVNYKLKDE